MWSDEISIIVERHRINDVGFMRICEIPEEPDDDFRAQVAIAAGMLRDAPRSTAERSSQGSYALKHRIEEVAGAYISNGATIVAAYMLGIPVWSDAPNGVIGAQRSFLCLPTGTTAERSVVIARHRQAFGVNRNS